LPIHLGPGFADRRELGLNQQRQAVTNELGPITARSPPARIIASRGGAPERPLCAEIGHGFEQGGLAGPVGPVMTVVPTGSGSKRASTNRRKSCRWRWSRLTGCPAFALGPWLAGVGSGDRTGINRYRKLSFSAPWTVAGLPASAVSTITSSPSTASTPSIR